MKRFLLNVSLVSVVYVLVQTCFFVLFSIPPTISSSYSLDKKLFYLYTRNFEKRISTIAVGSSMTLNNLHSETLVQYVGNDFFNISSWGQSIETTFYLSKFYIENYVPTTFILVSSFPDFSDDGENHNYELPTYEDLDVLLNKKMGYLYLNLKKDPIRVTLENVRTKDSTLITSLNFDIKGGVKLNVPKEKIEPGRWNEKFSFPKKNTKYQYECLASFCSYLEEKKVQFIFIQPPYRKGYVSTDVDMANANHHYMICDSIVKAHHYLYLNYTNRVEFENDDLFADQIHLQESGSAILTNLVISDLKANGISFGY
ncbi:hypothetical protein [uncultured Parabacteroides sp.]|uniref:hypothetical protein n=1 Tax=uncultured Parabacteroides sp. TaxID=512312 RepID=UPI0025FA9FE1|nr:hypothetical protein [uncultured Parabacteroides sp.]